MSVLEPVIMYGSGNGRHAIPGSDASLPLAGKTVLITGVSRRAGIGHAIACRAADYGANLALQHYAPHDASQEWGADNIEDVLASIAGHLVSGACLSAVHADLGRSHHPRAG